MHVLVFGAETETDDATRMDTNRRATEALRLRSVRVDRLPAAADLDAPHPPRIDGRNIIYHEGHPPVVGDVAELPARRHAVALDVDRRRRGVVVEADRADLQGPVGLDRREASRRWVDRYASSSSVKGMNSR